MEVKVEEEEEEMIWKEGKLEEAEVLLNWVFSRWTCTAVLSVAMASCILGLWKLL